MKRIVVFYSLSGHTRTIARKIAAKLRIRAVEIRTVKAYPDDYDVLLGLGKKETEIGCIPKLEPINVDFSQYDAIILGFPVWWRTYAPAMKTFLGSVNWKGKIVYPFTTNEGTLGHVPSDLKKALRGAMISPLLNVRFEGDNILNSDEEIRNWISAIAEDDFEDED